MKNINKIQNSSFFPWENGEKPYWINPENGIEWYVDKEITDWCTDKTNNLPKLNVTAFILATKDKNNKLQPLTRILMDKKTNQVIYESTELEAMACYIDILRLSKKIKK